MNKVTIVDRKAELAQNEFEALLHFAFPEKQERIKRLRSLHDAQNCLLADVLARVEICRATGIRMSQLEFAVGDYGKPLLVNDPCVHFNVSHAGRYIACAVSDVPVGIDIELIGSANMKIAERFFTPDERAYIMAGGDRAYRFCEVWTKKESRIKWEGKGLHMSLSSFSVLDDSANPEVFYHMAFCDGEAICHMCSTDDSEPSVRLLGTNVLLEGVII